MSDLSSHSNFFYGSQVPVANLFKAACAWKENKGALLCLGMLQNRQARNALMGSVSGASLASLPVELLLVIGDHLLSSALQGDYDLYKDCWCCDRHGDATRASQHCENSEYCDEFLAYRASHLLAAKSKASESFAILKRENAADVAVRIH